MSKYACAAAFLLGILLPGSAASAQTGGERKAVHVRGSAVFMPIAQHIAETYMNERPDRVVALSGGGSMRGYKSIIDGTADIALVSHAVLPELKKEIARRGLTLVSATAGYTAIVPVVHPSNPLASLSMKQLKYIFSGRIANWKDIGGKTAPVNVYVELAKDGIAETWNDAVLGDGGTLTPKAAVISAERRIQLVAADPAAISYLPLSEINASVKALRIDGIAVTPETVLDGRHPVRSPLMLVRTDKASAATEEFIRYFIAPRKDFHFAGFFYAAPSAKPDK